MKNHIYWLIFVMLFIGCKHDNLPSKHITQIPVIRTVKDSPKVQEETNDSQTSIGKNVTNKQQAKPVKASRYHIIVESYAAIDKGKAEKLVKDLKSLNYPAQLLDAGGRYRVSIESFSTEEEAQLRKEFFRLETDRSDLWVLKL